MKISTTQLDSKDMKIMQSIYIETNKKSVCFELGIGHSTYSRRIKKLLNILELDDIQQLRNWVMTNLRN